MHELDTSQTLIQSKQETSDESEYEKDFLDIRWKFWTSGRLLFSMFIIFIIIGMIWFWRIEGLTFIDSLYTIVIIMTTTGYGLDALVENTETQIFLIFYCIIVCALIGSFLDLYLRRLVNSILSYGQDAIFYQNDVIIVANEHIQDKYSFIPHRWGKSFLSLKQTHFLMWFLWLFLGAFWISSYEGWTFVQTSYFAVISGSTIGFGDYMPKMEKARLVVIFWLPTIIGLTAVCFHHIFESTVYRLLDESNEELTKFKQRLLTLLNSNNFSRNIQYMDVNHDGEITEAEFMLQVLINEFGVSEEKLKILRSHFQHLDKDKSGTISLVDFSNYTNDNGTQGEGRPSWLGNLKSETRAIHE